MVLAHIGKRYSASQDAAPYEADFFAGKTIFRLGGSVDDAQVAFSRMSKRGSETHPGRDDRMNAAAVGWRDGREEFEKLSGGQKTDQCRNEWVGDSFVIEGRKFRQFRVCKNGQVQYQRAEYVDGSWIFAD